jgi:4'-phosphopantetheinyl transferase
LSTLDSFLDERDRLRCTRFKFADDRARFVLGRALVRTCLGRYLGQPPETVELALSDDGRPIYPYDATLRFNLTHSGDLVALAITSQAEIGIDVERIESHPDLSELAQRIFSEPDLETFRTFSTAEALTSFFRAWTRKEAYLKARGEGIAEGLPQISTSFGPEEVSEITDSRRSRSNKSWRLYNLPLPTGYAGSLACDEPAKEVAAHFGRVEKGQFVAE